MQAMNHMIPECLYLFGRDASKWFTNTGIHAFKDVQWNPESGRTISMDKDMSACVDEDSFGMGDTWRPKSTTRDSSKNKQCVGLLMKTLQMVEK